MLRLRPTQLKLEKRDLDWHIPRHEERQALRATLPPSSITKGSPKRKRNAGFPEVSPYAGRGHTSKHVRNYSGPDTDIFSDDPVPRGSRAFWDKVLAEAGTPTRIHTAPMARGTIVEPSSDFLNSTHSSRGSIESVSIDLHNGSSDVLSPPSDDVLDHSPLEEPSHPGMYQVAGNREANMMEVVQSPPVQPSSSRSRLSFFGFRRKTRPDADGSSGNSEYGGVDHRLSGSMAVDGPSDRNSSHYREMSRSSHGGLGPDVGDGLYGNRRDRRTISQAYSSRGDQLPSQDSRSSANGLPDRSILPPRAIGHPRNLSGSLPRSSLYISEAATSSSPERRPRTPTNNEPNGFQSQGLLSQPPRRRKMYRARSQTYSYAESDRSSNPTVPQMDGPSAMQGITASLPALYVSQPPRYSGAAPNGSQSGNHIVTSPSAISDTYLPSSPPEMPDRYIQGVHQSLSSPYSNNSTTPPQDSIEIRSYRSHSSILSPPSRVPSAHSRIHSSPNPTLNNEHRNHQRRLSPFAPPFVPGSGSRNVSPQLMLPPPFSATSRNVSFGNTYPPSSPASSHTPPQRQISNSVSPIPGQQHRRIPVYNDSVDPSVQPQTPIGLPRHGVLAMATHNPFYTAPGRSSGRFRALADWQAFATPIRRPSIRGRNNRGAGIMLGVDQENTGAIPEQERRIRREAAVAEIRR